MKIMVGKEKVLIKNRINFNNNLSILKESQIKKLSNSKIIIPKRGTFNNIAK
jgi:hypothetical protein